MYALILSYYTLMTGMKDFTLMKTGDSLIDDLIEKVRYSRDIIDIPPELIVRTYEGKAIVENKRKKYEMRSEIKNLGFIYKVTDLDYVNSLFCYCLEYNDCEIDLLARVCIKLSNNFVSDTIRGEYTRDDFDHMMFDIYLVNLLPTK